jgi:sugar lactone lactonase YvrE
VAEIRLSIRLEKFWFTMVLFLLAGCGGGGGSGAQGSSALGAHDLAVPPTARFKDLSAELVLGQVDFSSNKPNMGSSVMTNAGLNDPLAVAIDRSTNPNRVYVSDFNNNRILGWADVSGLTNGAPADLVIGQPNFSSRICNNGGTSEKSLCVPMHITVDNAGNLYVADRGNSRVLIYFTPFTITAVSGSGDTLADRLLGQPDFKSAGCSDPSISMASNASLCNPFGVAVDNAGNVYVADMANNRVVEYNTPLTTDRIADLVLGQPNFESKMPGVGPSHFNQPNDVIVDNIGNVYVADLANNRVLEFDTPLTTNKTADRVFGQPNFSSTLVNAGGGVLNPNAGSLSYPIGIGIDPTGNLYIAERGNSRVMEYDYPSTTDTIGDGVFGQPDFTTNGCNKTGVTAKSLCLPFGVASDSEGNVWVADFANHRVLRYANPGGPPPLPPPDEVTIPSASFRFEEFADGECSLQREVEFSFEKNPGDPTSGDGGHTIFDIIDSTFTATMTFPDGFELSGTPESGGKEDNLSDPDSDTPYGHEYEFRVDCSSMTMHVASGQNVTIHASGTLTDGHAFSGSGVATTHP